MKINNNEQSLVSIIIITYNSSKYVLETLESAKSQTYRNIELLVTDDCSTDETIAICRNWIEQNKERFIRTELITSSVNTGIPANCNRGLFAAKGEWLKFIAGDDALLPDCIELNLKFVLNNKNVNVLLSNVNMYLDSFDEEHFIPDESQEIRKIYFNDNITFIDQYNFLLKSDYVGTTPSLFIRLKTLKSVDGFDERFKLMEDYPLWLKLTKSGYRLHYLDKITVNYRKNPTAVHNMTQQYFIKPSFFRNENMRRVYIYPNLPLHKYIYQKYFYYCALFFKLLNGNKPSKVCSKLLAIITFRFNPIKYLLKRIKKFA